MGVVEFCYLWGDLDSPLLWGWLLWGWDFGLSVVSFCLMIRWFLPLGWDSVWGEFFMS